MTRCFTRAAARLETLIFEQIQLLSRRVAPRKIVIKPNWVLHATDPAFPISALVTDVRVLEPVIRACLDSFPRAESILIGDCPLQYADWPLLCQQAGYSPMMEKLAKASHGKIQFRDLRQEIYRQTEGNFLIADSAEHGDPRGYRTVDLGSGSHLEPIAHQSDQFAVNDYSSTETSRNHAPGSHRYLVCQSILDADLIINVPKWKAHQKSGLTGALKNLVGINGNKAYLPHFRRGAPKWGGDEYKDDHRWLYYAQTTLRERFQKRSRLAYHVLKPGWELVKKIRGIQTRLADPRAAAKQFYVAGGAWPGNDTLWRMIYDLNLIIERADASGQIQSTPQRAYFCIVDGLISGEANGPLQPLPRETDWLVTGDDPFEIDATLSWCMGFGPEKMPIISRRGEFGGGWGRFDLGDLRVKLDETTYRLAEVPVNFKFAPPPGWRMYLER